MGPNVSVKKTVCALLSTVILLTYCTSAVPTKKRIVIHVPETVKHVHHHITKKVPLPIVVFTKNPKEPKPILEYKEPIIKEIYHEPKYSYHEIHEPKYAYHEEKEAYHVPKESYHVKKEIYHEPQEKYHVKKEIYHEPQEKYHVKKELYHEPKEQYHLPKQVYHEPNEVYHEPKEVYHEPKEPYPSLTEDHTYTGYEPEYGGYEANHVVRGGKDYEIQMARGVVADYHEVKPKVLKAETGFLPLHLTPPGKGKGKSSYWSIDQDQYNYGTFKSYNPPSRPPRPASDHYFEMSSAGAEGGDHVTHIYPTESTKKKKKRKAKRIPHLLDHGSDPTRNGAPKFESFEESNQFEGSSRYGGAGRFGDRTPHSFEDGGLRGLSRFEGLNRKVPPQVNEFIEEDFKRSFTRR
ncbi:hypothetical protein M8J77_026093 [Diaphorina citri]|nr:hypothetical protein M8J77_026093 [Diaphorina citri]